MNINCINRTTSQFYLGDDLGNVCLDVCKLLSEDNGHMIYLESAIIDDTICNNCKHRIPFERSIETKSR